MERQLSNRRSRAEIFQDRIAVLECAPIGFEYKRFFGQLVLFPATNFEPIRIGTGMSERQLQVAIELQTAKIASIPEVFTRLMNIRDIRIRRLAREGFLDSMRAEENAKERIGYLSHSF